jgi:hypothetical protein
MYSPAERAIYVWSDGRQDWHVDPLRAYRRLVRALAGEQDAVIERARSDDPLAATGAKERLADAAREAFGLEPFDPATGQGTLDAEAEALLYDFLGWLQSKKGSPPTSPTSPGSTGSADSWADDLRMPSGSASGSTVTE